MKRRQIPRSGNAPAPYATVSGSAKRSVRAIDTPADRHCAASTWAVSPQNSGVRDRALDVGTVAKEARMVSPQRSLGPAAPAGATGADWRIQTPPTGVPIAAVPPCRSPGFHLAWAATREMSSRSPGEGGRPTGLDSDSYPLGRT